MSAVLNWGWVRVSGMSMTPTLHDGDRVLVRYGVAAEPGQVVLARFPGGPDSAVIKRASDEAAGAWWLLSDNSRAGSDSRVYGPGQVLAVAFRLWPTAPSRGRRSRFRRWFGQPVPAAPPAGL